MKKRLYVLFLCIFVFQGLSAQSNEYYIFVDDLFYRFSYEKQLGTGFAIKSNDKRFVADYYIFSVQNLKGFDNNGGYEYFTLDEIRTEVNLEKLNIHEFSYFENKKNWQVHEELSLVSEIFLIQKVKESNGSYNCYKIPVVYEGTRKNTVPTDLNKN